MCARPSKETSLEGCFVSQQQRGQQSGLRRGQLGGPKGGQLGGLKRGQLAGLKGGQLEASGGVNSEASDHIVQVCLAKSRTRSATSPTNTG